MTPNCLKLFVYLQINTYIAVSVGDTEDIDTSIMLPLNIMWLLISYQVDKGNILKSNV